MEITSDTDEDDKIVILSEDYKFFNEEEEEDYVISDVADIDSKHEFDDDDVDEFVDRAIYFQNGTPFFHGLTEEQMSNKKQQIERHTSGHYRSITDHEELYHQMMTSLLDFISPEQLKMLWHKYDTCLNEALNQSVASFAPKNKCF